MKLRREHKKWETRYFVMTGNSKNESYSCGRAMTCEARGSGFNASLVQIFSSPLYSSVRRVTDCGAEVVGSIPALATNFFFTSGIRTKNGSRYDKMYSAVFPCGLK